MVAVTCGLGRWTPRWMQWSRVAAPRRRPGRLDQRHARRRGARADGCPICPPGCRSKPTSGRRWAGPMPARLSIAVSTPTAEARACPRITSPLAGCGRRCPTTARALHVRRVHSAGHAAPAPPAAPSRRERNLGNESGTRRHGRTAGLVGNWDPASLAQRRDATRTRYPVDRWLVGLGLVLVMAGVIVDRMKVPANSRPRTPQPASG